MKQKINTRKYKKNDIKKYLFKIGINFACINNILEQSFYHNLLFSHILEKTHVYTTSFSDDKRK